MTLKILATTLAIKIHFYKTLCDNEMCGKHVHIFSYLDMLFFYYYRFGFVTYSNPESVDAYLRDIPHKIDEKLVETKRTVPREDFTLNMTVAKGKFYFAV